MSTNATCMNNRDLIEAIADEAQALLCSAIAGGSQEQAFDLWADTDQLQSIHDKLVQFGTEIGLEISNKLVNTS